MSHLDAIELAGKLHKELLDPIVLIAEDDIEITTTDFLERISSLLEETSEAAPDWDMLLFGASETRADIAPSVRISENIMKAGFTYMTTLYAVSHGCTEKFAQLRTKILENCLVFDELHNALAGYTERVRPDLKGLFFSPQDGSINIVNKLNIVMI